jgi:hypothetical protein
MRGRRRRRRRKRTRMRRRRKRRRRKRMRGRRRRRRSDVTRPGHPNSHFPDACRQKGSDIRGQQMHYNSTFRACVKSFCYFPHQQD